RLVTAQLPFKADTAVAMIQSQLNDPPTPSRRYRADLPEWLDRVLTCALAKSPADRYQTADQLREALQYGMAGTSQLAALPAAAGAAAGARHAADVQRRQVHHARKRKGQGIRCAPRAARRQDRRRRRERPRHLQNNDVPRGGEGDLRAVAEETVLDASIEDRLHRAESRSRQRQPDPARDRVAHGREDSASHRAVSAARVTRRRQYPHSTIRAGLK